LVINDLNFEKRRYDNNEAYRQSKQANRMISWYYADKFKHKNITVNACHPGVINTQLLKDLGFGSSKSPSQGAETPIW
jgi:NAD(P)-dependent dehydrogenase (short-subunit alcohol dehydrogenase family)